MKWNVQSWGVVGLGGQLGCDLGGGGDECALLVLSFIPVLFLCGLFQVRLLDRVQDVLWKGAQTIYRVIHVFCCDACPEREIDCLDVEWVFDFTGCVGPQYGKEIEECEHWSS